MIYICGIGAAEAMKKDTKNFMESDIHSVS